MNQNKLLLHKHKEACLFWINQTKARNITDDSAVNLKQVAEIYNSGPGMSEKLWFLAIKDGHYDRVDEKLGLGQDVNVVMSFDRQYPNWSGLHLATWLGQEHMVKLLLSQGAKADQVNNDNKTALDLAKEKGYQSLIRLLESVTGMTSGNRNLAIPVIAKPNIVVGNPIGNFEKKKALNENEWFEAVRSGNITKIKEMVQDGQDINVKKMFDRKYPGWSGLHFAAWFSHARVIEYLLGLGADSNVETNRGETPKDLAEDKGIQSVIKLF